MTTQLPSKPVVPASYKARVAESNAAIRQTNRILAAARYEDANLTELMAAIDAIDFGGLMRTETDEERRDREAYNAAVAEYNRPILAARAAAKRAAAERQHAREVAQVRAALCPSCFTVPSASGACC